MMAGEGTGSFHPSGEVRKRGRGCWRQGLAWEGLLRGACCQAPFQPGQVQLRSAVWASGGLGRVREGHRNRDGAAAKPDWLLLNGGLEQGQWWGRDTVPTLLGRLGFLGNQKSEGGQNASLLTDTDCGWEVGCGQWPHTVRPSPSQGGRQRPNQRLPKGSAPQRPGAKTLRHLLLSPSLDQLALLVLFVILFLDSPECSTTHMSLKSLDLFSVSLPICKMGALIVSVSLGSFEGSGRAPRGSTSVVSGTQ